MDKKQNIIRLLDECLKLEDEAIPLYTKYLEDPEFFEDVSPQDVDRVKKALMTLVQDSRSHRRIFESLQIKVKETFKDAQ